MDLAHVLCACLRCAVITVDARSRVSGFNPQAEQLLRMKAGAVLGQPMERLPAPVREIITEARTSGKTIQSRQAALRRKKRDDLALRITATPIRTTTGKVGGVAVVMNDVSSANQWEANILRLDRLHNIGTLSASMAHEAKNAFVAVKTFVDLLLEQNKDADLAEVVRSEMNRIDSILARMRNFSGPAKPAFSTVRLHPVLDKSLHLIRHLLEEKKVRVTRSFAASPDWIHADQDQLEQAFTNLFFNALDALRPHGKLAVHTETIPAGSPGAALPGWEGKPLLRLVIRDDGAGIAPEHMGSLFQPFFTTKPKGTGLGLAITRRIIQDHGGLITAQSAVNKGTVFNLMLPLDAPLSENESF
jgi:nitrogen-specific signal transduction histidine kinase